MGRHSQLFRYRYQIRINEVSQCDWKGKIIIELAPNEPLSGFWSVFHEQTRTLPTSPSFVVWSCLLCRGSGSRCSAAQASSPPNISSPPKVSSPTFPFVATQNFSVAGSLAWNRKWKWFVQKGWKWPVDHDHRTEVTIVIRKVIAEMIRDVTNNMILTLSLTFFVVLTLFVYRTWAGQEPKHVVLKTEKWYSKWFWCLLKSSEEI